MRCFVAMTSSRRIDQHGTPKAPRIVLGEISTQEIRRD
ncbi:hypothetical protein NB311A_15727 [Nitrobacter sp. Nb-311A]|nr:hypothetical protein NB311A_15727 [Nitrobacter sp. Nb-311A]